MGKSEERNPFMIPFETLLPISQEQIEQSRWLQTQCYKVYMAVAESLQAGMSEVNVEQKARDEFAKRGVTEFWYNIPIYVWFGSNRFKHMRNPDYDVKKPRADVILTQDAVVHIDMHPQYPSPEPTRAWWGNFAGTFIWRPDDNSQAMISYLDYMQQLQRQGISKITAETTCRDVADWFLAEFERDGTTITDVGGNFGHNMGYGSKNAFPRSFVAPDNPTLLAGQIWGIEPGGFKGDLVARFETCIYLLSQGQAQILGVQETLPLTFT